MAKAVFATKVSPVYDDLPEEHYHFPATYRRQVEAAVGDWIVYYEPRRPTGDEGSRGGRQVYFATARLRDVVPDPTRADHYYALVSDYAEFITPVPFRDGAFYYETALRKDDGSTNRGAFGRAVRPLPDAEYDLIFAAGFAQVLVGNPEIEASRGEAPPARPGVGEPAPLPYAAEPPDAVVRRLKAELVMRPVRERIFATLVKSAYRDTCAFTGLKIINGGGRSEVQAGHIRPVASDGPDSVRNGLAMSSTIHWMFDRGLVSVDDDYGILLARGRVPDTVERMINPGRKLQVPGRPDLRPHRKFLEFHRREVFKG